MVKYLEYNETREVSVDQLLHYNGDPTNVPAHDSLLKHPMVEHKFEARFYSFSLFFFDFQNVIFFWSFSFHLIILGDL